MKLKAENRLFYFTTKLDKEKRNASRGKKKLYEDSIRDSDLFCIFRN